MPWIDKSTARTYHLVHRPQNDPRIHDESSSPMVFQEVAPTQARKQRNRGDHDGDGLGDDSSSTFGSEADWDIRDNEGEAAEHGIYYDDTEYDYMQHMRDLGSGSGADVATWMEAPSSSKKSKGKDKVSLEEALKTLDIQDVEKKEMDERLKLDHNKLNDPSILPSTHLLKTTHQNQQAIPDEIAGFQPDMDPRLREVLEALEDDAYVEDDEDDFFAEISQDNRELSKHEFEDQGFGFEDDYDEGWESDRTAKPDDEHKNKGLADGDSQTELPPSLQYLGDATSQHSQIPDSEPLPDHGDGEFMASFHSLNKKPTVPRAARKAYGSGSVMTGASSLMSNGRKKKRKGALTSSDTYSMTSSALQRTEGLTLLDSRFEKILESYEADDDDEYGMNDSASILSGMSGLSKASGVSKASVSSRYSTLSTSSSQAPELVNKNFDSIMDEFLGGFDGPRGKKAKKGKTGGQTGMQQLDEIRRELGKARVKA